MNNKDKRKNENSANYRNSIKNEKRKENNFNTRDRDYNNYEEFAEESTVSPLDQPINGRIGVTKSRNNQTNRKVNDSLDD
ncbi:hypothetical protein RJG79_06570 [Mycoplasmatota bacterium WC44]